MIRLLSTAALLAALLPASAQTNRAARASGLNPGLGTGRLAEDLRITLPGDEQSPQPQPGTARVFVPPELMVGNQGEIEADTQPIPLLRSTYTAEVNAHMVQAMRNMASNQVFLASRELWQASRLAPHLPEPAAGLALTYLLAEDNERAGNLLERLVKAHPGQDDLRFNLASARYGQKRYEEAVALLEGLTKSDKYPVRVHYNLGINLQALGRAEEAARALRRAHALDPKNPAGLLAIARMHARRGERPPMLDTLREASPLLPPARRLEELADPAFNPYRDVPEFQNLLRGEVAP